MSPENPTGENLLYTRCTECLNEGWLFCTLCNRHFCDEHACHHLAAQVDKDVRGIDYDASNNNKQITFREVSGLTSIEEIPLRSYLRRLLSEAKRVRQEIERRMIYGTELVGGPSYRNKAHLSGDARDKARNSGKDKLDTSPEAFAARLAKEEAERKRAEANKARIAEAIKILSQQIKLGNLRPEDIKRKAGK